MQLSDFKHREWESLTEFEKDFLRMKGVINGCGGAGNNIKNILIRGILKWSLKRLRLIFIQADCDYHDFSYWKGGNEDRRYDCDMGFFQAIMDDVYLLPRGFIPVVGYAILALIFYISVRIGGKEYFSYT